MAAPHPTRRFRSQLHLVLIAALSIGLMAAAGPVEFDSARNASAPKATVVLLHGAFADASGWNDVSDRLQDRGYTVIAPANPLRGLAFDSAYVSSVLGTIEGPIVLVGHSYGPSSPTQPRATPGSRPSSTLPPSLLTPERWSAGSAS